MTDGLAAAIGRDVSHETLERLKAYASLLREENERQNLISSASLVGLWERHIVDSAQLARFESWADADASWVDIGSGAGLPGIVLACLVDGPVTLVEPRRLRAEFLNRAVTRLGLNATVVCSSAAAVSGLFDVITARAVAPLGRLLEISHHLSTGKTLWVLPKGRSAQSELAEARRTWQGTFHVERSITDTDSYIVIGKDVRRKK